MYGLHKGLFRSLCKATKFFEMVNKHHKDAFDRISEERRERILEVGTEEFSSKGYENANINVIAKNAGISIGLMYKYFATKEDLFITCIQRGMRILSQVIEEIMASDDKLLVKAEKLIRATCVHSKRNANYIRLYNEIASEKTANAPKCWCGRLRARPAVSTPRPLRRRWPREMCARIWIPGSLPSFWTIC